MKILERKKHSLAFNEKPISITANQPSLLSPLLLVFSTFHLLFSLSICLCATSSLLLSFLRNHFFFLSFSCTVHQTTKDVDKYTKAICDRFLLALFVFISLPFPSHKIFPNRKALRQNILICIQRLMFAALNGAQRIFDINI